MQEQPDPLGPLRNPFRSEADAFRLLMIIGGAVLAVVLATVLGGPWVGVPVAVLLLGAGTRASYRWIRQAVAEPDEGEITGADQG